MRILYVVGGFPKVSETFILNQITGTLRRGHQVQIYAVHRGSGTVIHPDVSAYSLLDLVMAHPQLEASWTRRSLHALRMALAFGWRKPAATLRCLDVFAHGRRAASLELFFAASPFFASGRFDVIHCHFGPNGLAAQEFRRLGVLEGRLITTFHGYDVNVLPSRLGPRLYEQLFRAGDMFTVGSEFVRERLLGLGADARRVVKLPSGVSVTAFPFSERRPDPDGTVRLITVGRLEEVKGVEFAIRALPGVLKTYPRLHYQIVGDGSLRESLTALVGNLGLEQHVEFLGGQPQDRVSALCERAHVFVYSGVVARDGAQEGLGVALLEAQASGLPIIASRVGGVAEAVLDGQSGFLVPAGDPDAIANGLLQLLRHPELWPELGKAGRRHVQDNYNVEVINDRLMALYAHLAESQGAGDDSH